jgi:hypothetical protein
MSVQELVDLHQRRPLVREAILQLRKKAGVSKGE